MKEQVGFHNDFQIKVENGELFFKTLKKGFSGEVGRQLLEEPVKEVVVSLVSGRKEFNLFSSIFISDEARGKVALTESTIIRRVAKRFAGNNPESRVIERGGNFVVTASGGTRLIIGKDESFSDESYDGYPHSVITITTGMEPYRPMGKYMQIVPAPLSTPESFAKVMPDFIEIVKATVDQIYESDKKSAFNDDLVIKTPKVDKQVSGEELGEDSDEKTVNKIEAIVEKIEISKPNVTFDEIGGQEKAKKEIQEIAIALTNPDLYKKWGTRPPKGILLYGPPRTGKTLMARALASQANATFFNVKASDIGSKWYGESENIVQGIFDAAYKREGNTIIFFDEIDAIGSKREGSHEANQKVLSMILVNMDGIEKHSNVIVVGSTNRLDSVDAALTSAGRFDRLVEVALPKKDEKKQIFEIHMKKAQARAGSNLFHEVDLDILSSQIKLINGADIEEIVRRVLVSKFRQERDGKQVGLVTTEDFLHEIADYERGKDNKRAIGFVLGG